MLLEHQTWRFRALPSSPSPLGPLGGGGRGQGSHATYILDLDWDLEGLVDLTFGRYAYGGLFIRMPYRKEKGGSALTSEGLAGTQGEGKRARWVAIAMPIDGREDEAGIAMMDHPSNPEHPVPWRIDGQLGISPSRCIAGPWTLPRGGRARYRHRVLVFTGPIDAGCVEQAWRDFAES